MYLVDTNIIIWVLRGSEIYEKILQRFKNKGSISISTVTVAEVFMNSYPSELTLTENILKESEILDVNYRIAKQGGLYWQQYNKKFKNLSLVDCIIAATAKDQNLTLLTLNVRHFPMDNIRILNPLK